MSTYVPAPLRRQVRSDAGDRCGYCRSSERWLGIAHEIEHIIPEAEGGQTFRENLFVACRRCNSFKADRSAAVDPVSNETVALFHPRNDRWSDHFRWSFDGTQIVGLTPAGRATVAALQLNQELIVITRRLWVTAGIHPPHEGV